MKPLYIFDLDGTLADTSHRLHHINGDYRNWDAFHAACVDDKPHQGVIAICEALSLGADIWIWTGRDDSVKEQTQLWLGMYLNAPYTELAMRPHGIHIEDTQLKREWYDTMSGNDKKRLVAAFDDRLRVAQMWRALGVTCLHVADGNF